MLKSSRRDRQTTDLQPRFANPMAHLLLTFRLATCRKVFSQSMKPNHRRQMVMERSSVSEPFPMSRFPSGPFPRRTPFRFGEVWIRHRIDSNSLWIQSELESILCRIQTSPNLNGVRLGNGPEGKRLIGKGSETDDLSITICRRWFGFIDWLKTFRHVANRNVRSR